MAVRKPSHVSQFLKKTTVNMNVELAAESNSSNDLWQKKGFTCRWGFVFCQTLTVKIMVKELFHFMGPGAQSLSANGLYPERVESNPHPPELHP
jgi:hypothetical protein